MIQCQADGDKVNLDHPTALQELPVARQQQHLTMFVGSLLAGVCGYDEHAVIATGSLEGDWEAARIRRAEWEEQNKRSEALMAEMQASSERARVAVERQPRRSRPPDSPIALHRRRESR